MPGRAAVRLLALTALGLAGIAVLSGCSPTDVTAGRLEGSIAQTFSHLYVLQQVEKGNPRPDLRSLDTSASCQKGTPSTAQNGAGNDWVCDVTYLVAAPSTTATATYNVNVQTNGCYAADDDGPPLTAVLQGNPTSAQIAAFVSASLNSSRTITGAHNQQVYNPLWLIDGCFDVT